MSQLSFQPLTGGANLSANAYLVEAHGVVVLLDAGAVQGEDPAWVGRLKRPDLCWISHVHWDHLGALGALRQRFATARCVSTATTRRLAPLALAHGGLQPGRASAIASGLQVVSARRYFDLSTHSDKLQAARFRAMAFPAGHIPGAAMLLVEVDLGKERPFRLLYTGDFCGHDQPLVPGALFPRTDAFPIDVLVMEGVLATREDLDTVDYGAEMARLVEQIAGRSGPALLGVATLGEAGPVVRALADRGLEPLVHRSLAPVIEAVWPEASVDWGDDSACRRALAAGRVVVAAGEQYAPHTPAGRALQVALPTREALVVVLNRAHRGTIAARMLAAQPGQDVRFGGQKLARKARVERVMLPNHAPRSQLVEAACAVDPDRLLLVHGHRSQLYTLGRAVKKAGFEGIVDVPADGERIELD